MTKRTIRALLFAAAVTLPASAGHSQSAGPMPATEAAFVEHFTPYSSLPPEPEAAGKVVDLDTFDPPVEPEPVLTVLQSGGASYYGRKFHGRRTASGEAFDMRAMTAAHRTLPFGTLVQVTNPRNGKSVTVRINDRGPFHGNRVIDVSRAAAEQLGLIQRGHGRVELALLD